MVAVKYWGIKNTDSIECGELREHIVKNACWSLARNSISMGKLHYQRNGVTYAKLNSIS
jgi:hypothetical protein